MTARFPTSTYVVEGLLPDEVLARIDTSGGSCWLWTGGSRSGYGVVRVRPPGAKFGTVVAAHRFVYEVVKSERIPQTARDSITNRTEPVELDHKCRVPLCVNPDHLEPVTKSENLRRRGQGPTV